VNDLVAEPLVFDAFGEIHCCIRAFRFLWIAAAHLDETQQRSPRNLHPPLQLHLKAPEEPGFFLERIPIRTLKQVWGVLEVSPLTFSGCLPTLIGQQIVREQCWLNEILTGIQWTPQGPASNTQPSEPEEATEDELQAVLSGEVLSSGGLP
jgi:hypothetical protein